MCETKTDGVFETLSLYTRLYSRECSVDELTHGIGKAHDMSEPSIFSSSFFIDNFERAASRAGLKSSLKKMKLKDIDPLNMPLILLMKDGSSAILDNIEKDNLNLLRPSTGDSIISCEKKKLEEIFSGYLFLIGTSFNYSERGKPSISKKGKHWFWSSIAYSKNIYFDVLKASVAINIFVIASPLFTMNVYDRVVPNNAVETLWVMGIGVISVFIMDAVIKFIRTYFIETAAKKSDIIISSRLFETAQALKLEEAPRNIGSFAANFKEFDAVRNFLTSSVVSAIVDLPFTVLFLVVINFIGGKLVIVPIVMMVLILFYTLLIKNSIYKSIAASFQASSLKNAMLIEMLYGLRDIKLLNASGIFQWKWENIVAELAKKGIKSRMLSMSINTITGLAIQLNTVLIVIYGVYLIRDLELTMGGMIAVVILSSRTISPMGQVVSLISGYQQTKVAYQSLDKIMNQETESLDPSKYIPKYNFSGEIEFREVSFNYPGSEKEIIRDVSFKIEAGERIGLIGRTGSGKSTIQKLLLGFYKPTRGTILIDGIDINQINPMILRKNINHVPQDFMLFSGSLLENLTYKAPYADEKSITEAIFTGGLENYVQASSEGLHTIIHEGGKNLSGGLRQGVAIARAFITDADIILLDEPTNSMDGSTESKVKKMLKKRSADKTTVLTTHKNGMLDMVDKVIVLERGSIVFRGSQKEMISHFASASQTKEKKEKNKIVMNRLVSVPEMLKNKLKKKKNSGDENEK